MAHDGPVTEGTNSTDLVIDISSAVLLFRYFRICRRIVLVGGIALVFWAIVNRSLALAAGALMCGGLYVSFRQYYRGVLIAFSWISIPTSVAIALAALWKSAEILRTKLTVPLLVPISVIVLFLYISNRVLQTVKHEDAPYRRPGDPYYTGPTFSETFLSGGWRSMFLLSIPWYLWAESSGAAQTYGCLLLGISLFILALNFWALIPSARAVSAVGPLELLRAIDRSDPRATNRSYTWFLLHAGIKRPIAAAIILSMTLVLTIVSFALVVLFSRVLGLLPILAGLTLWMLCSRVASRHILSKAMNVKPLPSEVFTLYLRSFIDDDFRILRDGLLYRVWLSDPLFEALRYVRFEEALVDFAWPYGKLVTLTRPGNKMPDIGAIRMNANPEGWQETIMRYVDSADRVVMAVGFTSGLRWELNQFDGRRLSKLTLTFVPEHPEQTLETWRQFTIDSPQLANCGEGVIAHTIAARFLDSGVPVFLTAQKRSLAAYRLALTSCFAPSRILQPFIEVRPRAATPKVKGATGYLRSIY